MILTRFFRAVIALGASLLATVEIHGMAIQPPTLYFTPQTFAKLMTLPINKIEN